MQIAQKFTRRSVSTHAKVLKDLSGARQGCKPSGGTTFAAILGTLLDLERKSLRRREKFSKILVRNPIRIARNLTRRSVPTLNVVCEDL